MKVSVGKKTYTVTVERGDVEAAKGYLGKYEDQKGPFESGVSVEDKKGQQWKLVDDVDLIEDHKPGKSNVWEKTYFEIGTFTGIPMDPIEERKLGQKCTEYNKIKGQVVPDDRLDKKVLAKIKSVITGWDLVNEVTGEPVPCTDAMKEEIYLCNPAIIDEAMAKFSLLGYTGGFSKREEELKNS